MNDQHTPTVSDVLSHDELLVPVRTERDIKIEAYANHLRREDEPPPRRGRGRERPARRVLSPLMENEPTTKVSTTIERRLLDALTAIADHNGITVADLMRNALWTSYMVNIDPFTGEIQNLFPLVAVK